MALPERTPFSDIASLIRGVTWPVMPEVGVALIRTMNDDSADTATICRIIRQDPALTATLLRMANSALFGLSGSVNTLERAISVVGVSMVRTRALSLCMARGSQFPAGMDRMAFWRYSLMCASVSQWLGARCKVNAQEAWLCGMMLRLGGLSIVQARPEHLGAIESDTNAPGERWVNQRLLVGFDEGEVTAELAQHWDFPPSLVAALRYCAQPLRSSPMSELAAVLHLAARLADSGSVTFKSVADLPSLLLQLMAIEPQALLVGPPEPPSPTDVALFK